MDERGAALGRPAIGLFVIAAGIFFRAPASAPPARAPVAVERAAPPKATDVAYEAPDSAITGYDRGRRLIAEYTGRSWPVRLPADTPRMTLRVTIAAMPDPYDSHMDWSYDANLEALRRAMGKVGFVPHSFWLPAHEDSIQVTTSGVSVRYAAHDFQPGVFLFRSIDAQHPAVHIVYLVSELPTSGLHLQAFRAAVAERAAILRDGASLFTVNARERVELSILGPNFSGSAATLRALVDRVLSADDTTLRTVRIISGSATSFNNLQILTDTARTIVPCREVKCPPDTVSRIRFAATVNPDIALDEALRKVIASLDIAPFQVAVLAESGTAYGAATLTTSGDTAQKASGLKNSPSPGSYLTVPFPLNIASLRSEFERSPSAAGTADGVPRLSESPRSRLSLEEASRSRETPALTSNLSVASLDVVLEGILRTLNEHDTRVVVIKATDVRDKLFLARELRRWVRDVVIIVYEGHMLLRRPEYADALRGALVLSSYPMSLENQYWSSSHRIARLDATYVRLDQLLAFPTDAATGVYNATLSLLGRPELRAEFALHGLLPSDSTYRYPPIWLSVIGRDGFYPLRAFVSDTSWRSYLDDPSIGTVDAASERDRRHEHSFTQNGFWLSVIIIAPAFVILALLVMFLVGRPTLNRLGLVLPPALARPASAAETLYLALFVLSMSATYLPFSVAVDARRIVASVDRYGGGLSAAMQVVLVLSAIVVLIGTVLLANGVVGLLPQARPAIRPATGHAGPTMETPPAPVPAVASGASQESPRIRLRRWMRAMRSMPRLTASTSSAATAESLHEYPQQTTRNELAAVRLAGLLGIVVACVVFISSSFEYTWHLVSMSRDGGVEATLSMYRALHLTSGVSPLLPLVLLGAGFTIWAWWQLQQARISDHPDHFENGVRLLAHDDHAAALWRRAYRAMVDARRGLNWIAPNVGVLGIIAVIAVICLFVERQHVPSLELVADTGDGGDRWFDVALWLGLMSLLVSSAWAIYRLVLTWSGMERFLDVIGGSPLSSAFARLPVDVARLTDLGFLGFRRDDRSVELYADEQWQGARADVVAATAAQSGNELAVVLSECVDKSLTQPRGQQSVQCALETLRRAWELARTRADLTNDQPIESSPGDSTQVRAMRSLEEYVACEIVLYVEHYLQNLRLLCFFLFASLLILVTVDAQYPYEPHTVISLSAVILLVLTVLTVFVTMVRMSRNMTLSRISRTQPGKVTWNTAFILNLVTFGVVPLLALVSSEFPEVRSFLFSWAEPLVRAVAKG